MGKSHNLANEAEWHSIRSINVGGSEVAALFYRWRLANGHEAILHLYEVAPEGAVCEGCVSTYTTGYRLWQEKAGILPPNFVENERVDAGSFLEPALAAWAKKKWSDFPLRKVHRYISHESVEGWGASFDYEVHGQGVTGEPVEFKNVDFLIARDLWVIEGDEIVVPPLPLLLQVQHQIGANDADGGWMVACIGGNRLLRGRVPRHEPTQAKIAEAISAFWRGVRAGVAPDHVADYGTAAELYADGYRDKATDLEHFAGIDALCGRLTRLQRHIKRMEAREEVLKGQVAAAMGDATRATAGAWRISWPAVQREEKLVPERVVPAMAYRGALRISRKD